MSPLRFRRRPRLGPLRFNITERGLRSVSIKVGPFTLNPTRQRLTTNLPDGLYHQADLRPTVCTCGHAANHHVRSDGARRDLCDAHNPMGPGLCPCRRYRRVRR